MPLKVQAWLTTDGKLFLGEGEAQEAEEFPTKEAWYKLMNNILDHYPGPMHGQAIAKHLWAFRGEIVEILSPAAIDKAPAPGIQKAGPPNWMADCLKKDG